MVYMKATVSDAPVRTQYLYDILGRGHEPNLIFVDENNIT